ncbi:annexin A1 [Xenopus laevis]|uniref:Annexin n=1 Tax=Xenopus laevis TaxID=8355 RepID=A0A8J1MKC3_XENLA|nr:annexin A1 [Xenopus laevis]
MDPQSNTSIVHQMLKVCQQTQVCSTVSTIVMHKVNAKQQQQQQQQQQHGGTGTIPQPKYDASEDARALEKATKPKEVDEGTIIDIITKRNNDQHQELKAAYEKLTKKTLVEALKAALSGDLEEIILDLLKTPAQFDADEMKRATKGLGTDEDCIIEILASRTNQQIKKMKEAYEKEYKTTLEKDITADTSGDFQKALLILLKGERSEDCYVNEDLAKKDAKVRFFL